MPIHSTAVPSYRLYAQGQPPSISCTARVHLFPMATLSAVDNYCHTVYGKVMNVHLGSVLDEFVADLLKSGYYQTQSEVLREGLRLLKEREEIKRLRVAELRKEIAVGIEQADRGQFVDGPEAFAKIRRRSAQRKRSKG